MSLENSKVLVDLHPDLLKGLESHFASGDEYEEFKQKLTGGRLPLEHVLKEFLVGLHWLDSEIGSAIKGTDMKLEFKFDVNVFGLVRLPGVDITIERKFGDNQPPATKAHGHAPTGGSA